MFSIQGGEDLENCIHFSGHLSRRYASHSDASSTHPLGRGSPAAFLLGKRTIALESAMSVKANVRGGGGDSGSEAARRSDPHESGVGAPPPRRSGGHRAFRLGWSCDASSWWRTDDRGQTATGRAAAEGRRRGFPADRRRGGAAAPDGERRGG